MVFHSVFLIDEKENQVKTIDIRLMTISAGKLSKKRKWINPNTNARISVSIELINVIPPEGIRGLEKGSFFRIKNASSEQMATALTKPKNR